ncbi:BMP family ABC transporter substrate-binding protein [Oceanobacter sp. 3_MG-2023]|uniref:BMP family ABC transporter substrate-binding protein n=2 Tax=Gammaproteobacteria TaxID=1236 RepID=UPI002733CAD3|nr:BMP family ABC transporter substrate-binding protein [Oceanobacter sp. 3_MG-2023]MDP2504203.1 BMP family ABC transporter substrate-binding protein [Oceanobacter sp. 3_MG-2023]
MNIKPVSLLSHIGSTTTRFAFFAAVLAIGLLPIILSSTAYASPIKAAFILVGPADHVGWSYSHNQGRLAIERTFGDKVETEVVEFVPEGRSSREVLQDLADRNDIVFATSFGYMVSTESIARDNPNVIFEHATGSRQGGNLGNYATRAYQPRYLSGLIAGSMTKNGKIGYVAAHPIPEVIRGINAFTMGVREVNPTAEVEVLWTYKWYDPEKDVELANQLIESGVDLLTHHTDSSAIAEIAEQKNVYVIGYHSDMRPFAPSKHLASVVHNWGPYYINRIQALLNNTWKPDSEWTGMAESTSQLVSISPEIPADIRRLVANKQQEIMSGQYSVFAGPIKSYRGSTRIKEGKELSDDQLLRMNWYVEGVTGSLLAF